MRSFDIEVMRIILGNSRRAEIEFKITKMIAKSYRYLTSSMNGILEKLTGPQLVKKSSAFYEIREFIIAFTNARYLPLS
jgi:hypothetical protein